MSRDLQATTREKKRLKIFLSLSTYAVAHLLSFFFLFLLSFSAPTVVSFTSLKSNSQNELKWKFVREKGIKRSLVTSIFSLSLSFCHFVPFNNNKKIRKKIIDGSKLKATIGIYDNCCCCCYWFCMQKRFWDNGVMNHNYNIFFLCSWFVVCAV